MAFLEAPHLKGRRALVTGASSGIGRATALALARNGVSVVATGRRERELETLRAEAPDHIEAVAGDLTDTAFVAALAERAGAVDILVNVAGVARHGPLLDADADFWQTVFDTNVISVMRLTQIVARGMAAREAGHIVIVSSVLARQIYPMTVAYAASKHAIAAFARGLRLELQPSGVQVSEVAPGYTGGTEFLRNTQDPQVLQSAFTRPYKPKTPEDCAQAILAVLSMTGHAEIDLVQLKAVGQP